MVLFSLGWATATGDVDYTVKLVFSDNEDDDTTATSTAPPSDAPASSGTNRREERRPASRESAGEMPHHRDSRERVDSGNADRDRAGSSTAVAADRHAPPPVSAC